jgi:hypothetical protein
VAAAAALGSPALAAGPAGLIGKHAGNSPPQCRPSAGGGVVTTAAGGCYCTPTAAGGRGGGVAVGWRRAGHRHLQGAQPRRCALPLVQGEDPRGCVAVGGGPLDGGVGVVAYPSTRRLALGALVSEQRIMEGQGFGRGKGASDEPPLPSGEG